jgi:hypothetical protein
MFICKRINAYTLLYIVYTIVLSRTPAGTLRPSVRRSNLRLFFIPSCRNSRNSRNYCKSNSRIPPTEVFILIEVAPPLELLCQRPKGHKTNPSGPHCYANRLECCDIAKKVIIKTVGMRPSRTQTNNVTPELIDNPIQAGHHSRPVAFVGLRRR